MECPTPRVALGQALRGIASAAADISDGLVGDLGHILRRSGVGASIDAERALGLLAARSGPERLGLDDDTVLGLVLAGGDDYELVFTAPAAAREAVQAASRSSQTQVTRIGRIEKQPGLRLLDARGQLMDRRDESFDHFK